MDFTKTSLIRSSQGCVVDALANIIDAAASPTLLEHQRNKLLAAIAQSLVGLLMLELSRESEGENA